MATACPCFGRNENCRLCGGSGLVTSEVEAKVARSQHSVQTFHFSSEKARVTRSQGSVRTFHDSSQSDDQNSMEVASRLAGIAAKSRKDVAKKLAAKKVAEAEAAAKAVAEAAAKAAAEAAEKAAEKRRQNSAFLAAKRLEAAALEAQTPEGKLALKLKAEQVKRHAEDLAAKDAEQAAKAIAYWNRLWGKS